MLESVTNSLQELASRPSGLVFALLLGVLSAATSACCTLPALGLIVGYSGAQANDSRKTAFRSALFFTLGTIIALMIIGAVAGLIGQMAQNSLGRYWKVLAGVAAIILGLATFKLLPFELSLGRLGPTGNQTTIHGAALAGLALGGIVAASSMPCNPGIYIVIGAAMLQGAVIWASLLMGMYAIGFSLPVGAVLLGVSLGKVSLAARGADRIIRWVGGSVLLLAGFYFVFTF